MLTFNISECMFFQCCRIVKCCSPNKSGVLTLSAMMRTVVASWLPLVMAAPSISAGSSPGLLPCAPALIAHLLKKELSVGNHPRACCPPQTMSSGPTMNIYACHKVDGAILKSIMLHVLRFLHPGHPVFAISVDCLNFMLLTFPG